MNNNIRRFKLNNESPLFQIFVSLLIIMGVGIALLMVLSFAGKLIFSPDLNVLQKSASGMGSSDLAFMRYILIVQDLALFIIPSIIIMRLMKPENTEGIPEIKLPELKETGLVIILAFCMFPVTGFTGQINSTMHLPDFLSGVEQWMIKQENNASGLLDLLIVAETFPAMLLNLLLIAVLPAVAEELIFRGVFQKIFYRLFRSGHLAIWFSAVIFSTIHFQFFGFIPRLILGLVFGYLFYWSGTLWLPVISHFVNNAFPVILAYIQGPEKFGAPVDASVFHQALILPLPVTAGIMILLYFRNKRKERDSILPTQQPEP
jgi:membrane protease YdiL (CAAX protease family)